MFHNLQNLNDKSQSNDTWVKYFATNSYAIILVFLFLDMDMIKETMLTLKNCIILN